MGSTSGKPTFEQIPELREACNLFPSFLPSSHPSTQGKRFPSRGDNKCQGSHTLQKRQDSSAIILTVCQGLMLGTHGILKHITDSLPCFPLRGRIYSFSLESGLALWPANAQSEILPHGQLTCANNVSVILKHYLYTNAQLSSLQLLFFLSISFIQIFLEQGH